MTRLVHRLLYGPATGVRVALAAIAIVPFIALALPPVSVPAGSADVVIGTVAPAGDAASLRPGEGTGGGAAGCLPRVQRGSAWMDVCWQAYRLLAEEDGTQDYYALEVSGTAHGEAGSGVRWAVLRARGELAPSKLAESGSASVELPDGRCELEELRAGVLGPVRQVTACEHWEAQDDFQDGLLYSTSWTCGSCLTGVVGDRDLVIVGYQGVPQGELPSWGLGADLGS